MFSYLASVAYEPVIHLLILFSRCLPREISRHCRLDNAVPVISPVVEDILSEHYRVIHLVSIIVCERETCACVLKLIVRLKSPAELKAAEQNGPVSVLKVGEKDLPWKNVARVQLWPEKCMILYYAPAWWMRIALACTPGSWYDVMAMTKEKLGRKKKIRLPSSLTVSQEPRPRRPVSPPQYTPPKESPGQLSMEDLMDDGSVPAVPQDPFGEEPDQN